MASIAIDQFQIFRWDFNDVILGILRESLRRFGQRNNVRVHFSDKVEVFEPERVSSSMSDKTTSHQVASIRGMTSLYTSIQCYQQWNEQC